MRLARAIEAGQVFVNNHGAGGGVELPFGGMKGSGFGREKRFEALYGFSTLKTSRSATASAAARLRRCGATSGRGQRPPQARVRRADGRQREATSPVAPHTDALTRVREPGTLVP
jgi:hypothetical protein